MLLEYIFLGFTPSLTAWMNPHSNFTTEKDNFKFRETKYKWVPVTSSFAVDRAQKA